jgi:hypothetical protein
LHDNIGYVIVHLPEHRLGRNGPTVTFDGVNFIQNVKQIITGSNLNLAGDGGYLADEDYSSQFAVPILCSTGISTFGPFNISRDYDQTSDQLQFRFLGSTAGTGISTITIYAKLLVYSTGGTSYTSPVQVTSTTFNNGVWNSFAVAFQGLGLVYPDTMYVTISTAGGNIQVATAQKTYSSCLVAWQDTSPTNAVAITELVGTSTQQIRTA